MPATTTRTRTWVAVSWMISPSMILPELRTMRSRAPKTPAVMQRTAAIATSMARVRVRNLAIDDALLLFGGWVSTPPSMLIRPGDKPLEALRPDLPPRSRPEDKGVYPLRHEDPRRG